MSREPYVDPELVDKLAFALPVLVGAWDEGRIDNVNLAGLIVRLVSGSIEADIRVLLARKVADLDTLTTTVSGTARGPVLSASHDAYQRVLTMLREPVR